MLLPPPFFSSSLISCAGRANAVAKMTVTITGILTYGTFHSFFCLSAYIFFYFLLLHPRNHIEKKSLVSALSEDARAKRIVIFVRELCKSVSK